MKRIIKLATTVVALSLSTITVNAASFDCDRASTKIERTICSDSYLSELDGKMGRLYHKASRFAHIKQEQRDWLQHRNRYCGANNDCLYDMTKRRVKTLRRFIRRSGGGGGNNNGSANRGSVYSPSRGVVCDRKSGFCADSYGISLGLTKEYLGQKNEEIWNKRMNSNFDSTVFGMSNRVYCDTNIRTCYQDKLKTSVNHYFTNRLFR